MVRVTRQQPAKEELEHRENDIATNISGCSLNPLVDDGKQSDVGEVVPKSSHLLVRKSYYPYQFRRGQSWMP